MVLFDSDSAISNQTNIGAWILGGFFVGAGTKLGNGCTSGHGVCGLPRLAPRSLVAVPTFIVFGMIMSTLRIHFDILTNGDYFGDSYQDVWKWVAVAIFTLIGLATIFILVKFKQPDHLVAFISGVLFGFGLAFSGMCRVSKVLGFLTCLPDYWDPSLMFVMAAAVGINIITFNLILRKREKPVYGPKYAVPPANGKVDAKLVIGEALFGIGWGFAGLCPGPGMIVTLTMTQPLIWLASLAIGQLVAEYGPMLYDKMTGKNAVKATDSKMNGIDDERKPAKLVGSNSSGEEAQTDK